MYIKESRLREWRLYYDGYFWSKGWARRLRGRMSRMACHIWICRETLTFNAYQQDLSFIAFKALAVDIIRNWEEEKNCRCPRVADRMFLEDIYDIP